VPRDRLHVVPVGVDPDAFRPLPHVTKVPGRVISTASSDLAVKGLAFLLEAIARVRQTRPDVELVVIGKPKADGPTPALLRRLDIDDAVRFVTGVSEERLIALYNEAEVAVVPSLYEGFSLPAVEAMSCGTALVATTGGALPEVVGPHGETVLLAPPGNAEALAQRIEEALGDSELRARLGAKGREWVLGRWTWRHSAHATVAQYRALLASLPAQVNVAELRR
jgi:glycosyltransferase involved in cell wall biosynthesis